MGKHFVASLLISHVMIRVKDEGQAGSPGLHVIHVKRVKRLRFILMICRQTEGRKMVVLGIEGLRERVLPCPWSFGSHLSLLEESDPSGDPGGPGSHSSPRLEEESPWGLFCLSLII